MPRAACKSRTATVATFGYLPSFDGALLQEPSDVASPSFESAKIASFEGTTWDTAQGRHMVSYSFDGKQALPLHNAT
jgi:hypothetical protein